MLIAVVDGLKGFPEAITAVFPETQVQTCIVHLVRSSLASVAYKDRKVVAGALKAIYRARMPRPALDEFATSIWGRKYETIATACWRNWPAVIPFFAFPEEVRRIIYTTDAIEALNAKLRRAVRARGHFPTNESGRCRHGSAAWRKRSPSFSSKAGLGWDDEPGPHTEILAVRPARRGLGRGGNLLEKSGGPACEWIASITSSFLSPHHLFTWRRHAKREAAIIR